MNIAMFSDTYVPQVNGVANSIKIYRRKLEERGHKVVVVAPTGPANDENVLKVRSIPFIMEKQHRIAIASTKEILDFTRKHEVQLIHSHSPFFIGFKALKVQEEMRIPHVHTYHTLLVEYRHYIPKPFTPPRGIVEHFSAWYCNFVNTVIAPTEEIKRELESYGVKRRIEVLPTGIEVEKFEKCPENVRERLGLSGKRVLLYVGRIAKEKNVDFLLKVYERVRSKLSDVVLLIVGDGPERDEVEEYAKDKKLEVVITGFVPHDEIAKYYKAGDVFVFASKTETQGLVVLEALASGVPVVALSQKGVKNVLKEREGAFLIEEESVEAFATRIEELLNKNELHAEFSKRGVEYVRKNWSVDTFVEKLERIYYEAIQEGPIPINTTLLIKEFVKFEKLKGFFERVEKRIWR